MKAFNWLRWRRRIINTLSRVQAATGTPLRRQQNAEHPAIEMVGKVQSAGQTSHHRPLQEVFPPGPGTLPGGWPDVSLYRIRQARLSGLCGSIFLPDGTMFSICPWHDRQEDKKVRRPQSIMTRSVAGSVLPLIGRNDENHGHFLFEYLPRVIAAEKLLGISGNWRIGIAEQHARWQRNYLAMLGYSKDRVVELHPGTNHIDELLFVPLLSGISSLPDPEHLRGTLLRLQQGVGALVDMSRRPEPAHVVFVSRSDAPNKRLLNEEELIEAARGLFATVDVVVLSELSFNQQVEAMAAGAIIIGPQGMGLSNMAFLSDRTLVCVECGVPQPEAAWDFAYCLAAEFAGNRSVTLYGGQDRIPPHRHFVYPVDRFAMEMKRLRALLEEDSAAR